MATLAMVVLPAVAAGETHSVTVDGMRFQPETLAVRRGDTVVWQNKDIVPHTVTATGRFDSGPIAAGASWSWTAGQAGRSEYVCTFHPGMKAAVVVQ
jgi:plastocyanin